jgi:hypothetical protein
MRLNEKQSLAYLKGAGFEIGPATFYREKKKVEEMKLKRLYHIAKIGFQDQHLDRIDNTELCLKLMWQNYHLERDPYKKFQMLKDIIMVQPYLSSYYEASKLIIDTTRFDLLADKIKNLQSEQNRQDNRASITQRGNSRKNGLAAIGKAVSSNKSTDDNRQF